MPRRPWLTHLLILLTGGASWGADPAPAPRVYSLRITIAIDLSIPGRSDDRGPTPPAPVVPVQPTGQTGQTGQTGTDADVDAEPAYALVVYDRKARTPALGALLDSTTIAASLKASGVVWRNAPIDDAVTVTPSLRQRLGSTSLPALMIVRGSHLINLDSCPTTEADVLAKVKATLGAVK